MRLLGRDNALARDDVRSGLLRDEGTPMQRLQPAPQDDVRGPPPIGDVVPAPYQEPPVPETQDSYRDAHENIWYAGVTLAILLLVAAVVLGGILWGRVDSHASHQSLDAICNTGSNAGSGLGGCENAPAVPGAPLLSAHASSPEHVLVNRINGAVGINATVEDGAVQISADVVSESPGLVVGVGPGDELTLSLDLPAVNVTPCNVTCYENYFVHQPNALLGYGMALGTDHIFADDNSHPGAAILSGYVNAIIGASGSVIAGGRYNTIDSTFCSLIGAGRNNTIIAPRAAIVIGQYNLVASGQSIVGAGQNNTIDSSLLANAILAGEENVVLESERSVIGVGYQCHIETSSDSGIYSGKENAIYDSVMCFVGSGQPNTVDDSVASGIVAGRVNQITSASYALIGGGEGNIVLGGASAIIGAGANNSVGHSYQSGILTGEHNFLTNSNQSCIMAGLENTVTDSSTSAIVAGDSNNLVNTTGAFIGCGTGNSIESGTTSTYNGIVVGIGNVISGVIAGGFIGAGNDNTLQ